MEAETTKIIIITVHLLVLQLILLNIHIPNLFICEIESYQYDKKRLKFYE